MKRILACTIAALLSSIVLARTAGAVPTPAGLCSSAVELAASKFAACRLKAESSFSKTGNATKRAADLAKCSTKFLDAFAKAQARFGVACPMVDPKEDFEAFLTQCTDDTIAAADGASLPACGNAAIDGAGEQCDGADLGGETCASLGFSGGTLGCDAGCSFDTSLCIQSQCGNAAIDAPEQCDGADLNGQSCVSLGYAGGALTCTAGCAFETASCDRTALPVTGQVTCWDTAGAVIPCAGTGQDGDDQSGGAPALVDNGDGTITDNNTGLVWEKLDDEDLGGIHDKDNFYLWDEAVAVKIAALNTSPCFAGHCDWRIPNVRELQSLANYEIPFPGPTIAAAFDSACTPGCVSTVCSCTTAGAYWSSTTYSGSPNFAWYVYFADSSVLANPKDSGGYARAVRTGP
jgi:hypothetical protein